MIVLDTNVVSELMKEVQHPLVLAWFQSLSPVAAVVTNTITVAEIEYGIQLLPSGKRRNQLERNFAAVIDQFMVIPFDISAAHLAGRFRAKRKSEGVAPADSDMMIAGIVASKNAVLATRNIRDFAGLPIQAIDPWRMI